ncbi:MAG: tyrosine-type recombinase/integrase [Gemmatimonadota bacterium]|nr:tyrosine-type recombinase/integrase [Gemmatimonadota bacterium]
MGKKRPARLSATFVRQVKVVGVYGDGQGGHGLALRVHRTKSGRLSKSWTQRLRVGGRVTSAGLGRFPIVTLREARETALQNARQASRGEDPRQTPSQVPSFEVAAERVIEERRRSWKPGGGSEAQWRSVFRRYVFPAFGAVPVSQVTSADVRRVLAPIWNRRPTVGRRIRSQVAAVMKWAIAENYCESNPAGDVVTDALPRIQARPRHFAALPHGEVRGALARVRASNAAPVVRLAFEFTVLTAARQVEVFGATWAEIDRERETWTIPAERMKAKREHRVPLAGRALEILDEAEKLDNGSGLVFPSPRGKKLSRVAFFNLLKSTRIEAVPHGFRSSFRNWCAETGVDRAVAEMALAHVVKNATEAAYFRTDLLEQRVLVMQEWATYVTGDSR